MSDFSLILQDLFENKPLYANIEIQGRATQYNFTIVKLKEVVFECSVCDATKPFHNLEQDNYVISLPGNKEYSNILAEFECVTCNNSRKTFSLVVEKTGEATSGLYNVYTVTKCGEYPLKPLPQNKELSKFLKKDKDEYAKAIRCLANGYGVAAFAYFRRIVENNIDRLLDLIKESIDTESPLAAKIAELKATSPMSDKISIANHALPDYLKPDGFNPLGQIYGLLSDGVHSLPDEQCLDKAKDLQVCLEFLISELAAHKKNREDFKNRLSAMRKK